jgi:hypothetical protein
LGFAGERMSSSINNSISKSYADKYKNNMAGLAPPKNLDAKFQPLNAAQTQQNLLTRTQSKKGEKGLTPGTSGMSQTAHKKQTSKIPQDLTKTPNVIKNSIHPLCMNNFSRLSHESGRDDSIVMLNSALLTGIDGQVLKKSDSKSQYELAVLNRRANVIKSKKKNNYIQPSEQFNEKIMIKPSILPGPKNAHRMINSFHHGSTSKLGLKDPHHKFIDVEDYTNSKNCPEKEYIYDDVQIIHDMRNTHSKSS